MSLIILTVLLAASVALVRSFDTTLTQAGNLAFKRDLANQAEYVMPIIMNEFTVATGSLSTPAAREASLPAENYSARVLSTNAQGIPVALLGDLASAPAEPATPIPPATGTVRDVGVVANDQTRPEQSVTIRYLIDRMCLGEGSEATLGDQCSGVDLQSRGGSEPTGLPIARQINYRVSVRVDGPRNTQAFFQTVFSF